MTPEASFDRTDEGLVPSGPGWFILNARDARWFDRPGRGKALLFTGRTEEEVEALFPQLGVNIRVVEPGEPTTMYHWETDAEAFLVLRGEALAIIEGEERRLRQWDFVHCPPGTKHAFVGAGDGPCTILAIGAREHQARGPWGAYSVDEAAIRHGAGVEEETQDSDAAYGRFAEPRPTPYGEGWLP